MPRGSPTNQDRRNRTTACDTVIAALCLAAAILLCAPYVSAQQLPFRHYDVADGLANSRVGAIYQDTKGYLWFGTPEGLSRFDGQRFVNYGTRDGLGYPSINTVIEDRQGRLWVGTNGGGVSRLMEEPPTAEQSASAATPHKKFISYPVGDTRYSNRINNMLFDASDNLWCATDQGLYRSAQGPAGELKFEAVVPHEATAQHMPAYTDRRGHMWFGMLYELVQVVEGRIIRHAIPDGLDIKEFNAIAEDRQGRLLVAFAFSLFEFIPPADASSRGQWKKIPLPLAPGQKIYAILKDAAGTLWIGTRFGLFKFGEQGLTLYTTAHGLSDNAVYRLKEDRDGNLWIGTVVGGVCKFAGESIVSFTTAEGLPERNVAQVMEARDGRIYASIAHAGVVEIVSGKAVLLPGSRPPPSPFYGSGWHLAQDRRDNWWVGSSDGLFRFTGPGLQFQRGRKFGPADGISESGVFLSYQDPTGRLWAVMKDSLYLGDLTRAERPVFERVSTFNPERIIGDRSGAVYGAGFSNRAAAQISVQA
jgi:ligand-binding sensor domain-containing protein